VGSNTNPQNKSDIVLCGKKGEEMGKRGGVGALALFELKIEKSEK